MSSSTEGCSVSASQKSGREVRVLPNPAAFFAILGESDVTARSKKLNSIELFIEDNDSAKHENQSVCSTTLLNLDDSWQQQLPIILHQLAGTIYIDKNRLSSMGSLGEGGFAVVEKMNLATPNEQNEIVAVKKLKPGVIEDDEDLKELVEESNLLRRVKHTGIVEFKGIGCFDETSIETMRESIFLAEEFMSGGTLKKLILNQMRSGQVRNYWMADAWRWLIEIAEALTYLHMCTPSVVHRDVKPENVLMNSKTISKAKAKIADFGLHKRIQKVAKIQRAKSSNFLDSLTNDDTTESSTCSSAKQQRPPSSEGIAIPKATAQRNQTERNSAEFAFQIPSHFRILKKSSSLTWSLLPLMPYHGREVCLFCMSRGGMHYESPLGTVPEGYEIGYAHMASAFSVPQPLIQDNVSPIYLVCPSSSSSESDASSLADVVDQIQNHDVTSTTSASLKTQCSEIDKKVRGGQLGKLLGLHQSDKKTINQQSISLPSQDQSTQMDNQPQRHFLFEPERETQSHTDVLEKKQRGSRKAFDQLKETSTSTSEEKRPLPAKNNKSVRFALTNRFALGLSGTSDVSGVVGSLMYMAPEVYKGHHYDEKVDVFGFGVVMYELLLSELVIVRVLSQARRASEMQHLLKKHAKSVAKGHREPIPQEWPAAVQQLIQDCWSQRPENRPRMTEVVDRLQSIEQSGCVQQMDRSLENLSVNASRCCPWCILS